MSEARAVRSKAESLLLAVKDWRGDIDNIRSAVSSLASVVAARTHSTETVNLDAAIDEYLVSIFTPDKSPRIRLGMPDIDEAMNGGMAPGTLTVLGARRGVGKTALGLNSTVNALCAGMRVVWVSEEMTGAEVTGRIIMAYSRVPTAGRIGHFSGEEKAVISGAADRLRKQALTIYEKPISPETLWGYCRRWRAMGKMDFLGVDYLQILKLYQDHEDDSQAQAISDAVVVMKQIAKEHKIPVLCLAQCRREGESQSKRVYMSSLKGSGGIEENADHVVLMWPDNPGTLIADLAKNRHGKTTTMTVAANFDKMTFGGVARDEDPPPAYPDNEQPELPEMVPSLPLPAPVEAGRDFTEPGSEE